MRQVAAAQVGGHTHPESAFSHGKNKGGKDGCGILWVEDTMESENSHPCESSGVG